MNNHSNNVISNLFISGVGIRFVDRACRNLDIEYFKLPRTKRKSLRIEINFDESYCNFMKTITYRKNNLVRRKMRI